MNKTVKVRSSGKLYIAGEYAVVTGGSAIIFPINKYVEVIITPAADYYVYSHKYHNNFIKLDLNSDSEDTKYIVEVIKWFNSYLKELNINIEKFKIEVLSQLDTPENQKYGFGSSAAILISVLKALFIYYNVEFDNLKLYKASVMIQTKISKYTSFGDLACTAFNEKIYYKKFNSQVFLLFDKLYISDLLIRKWEDLIIEKINLDLKFLIVNTKKEANSFYKVEKVLKCEDTSEFTDFYNTSEQLTLLLKSNPNDIKNIIARLDDNFKKLSVSYVYLYTSEMEAIRLIIQQYSGVMKFSGAGGGDSVICFFDNDRSLFNAKEELIKKGYDLLVYSKGGSEPNES